MKAFDQFMSELKHPNPYNRQSSGGAEPIAQCLSSTSTKQECRTMTAMMPDSRRVARSLLDTGTTNSRIGVQLGRHRPNIECGCVRSLREHTITVIAMTTEVGSVGDEVAARLVARFGLTIIRFANVAAQVADRLGVDRRAVLRYVNGSASFLERWRIDSRKLFHYASEEILCLAQCGNVLIEDWGAATLLRDIPGFIGVRLCAPSAFRAPVLMERGGTTDANAVRVRIERDAAAQARALAACLNFEGEDRRVYDIALNIERLSVESCVNAIVELAESRRLPDRAAMRAALAGKLIEVRIRSAFAEHISRSMAPLGVSVSVADEKVTLQGISCSGGVRRRAEEIARAISGALPIDNRIVSVPSHGRLWATPPVPTCPRPSSKAIADRLQR
jgi:cytidylate kinase